MTEKVLDNNIDLSEKFESRNSIAAIDWGLNCAFRHKKVLFLYSIIPALIEIAVAYISYVRTLSPQQAFLAFVLWALSNAWLVTAASMLAFELARDKQLQELKFAFTALKNLPKILLSYLGLLGLLLISFHIQPLLLVLVFMIWTPVFCIGEIYTWIDKPPVDPDDYDYQDDEEENFFTKKTVIRDDELSLFANKSVFELGYARSLQLGFRNVLTTLQAGLIIWCGNVVPAAIIGFFLPASMGFLPEAFKIFISTFFQAFGVCVVSGAFLLLLTEKSQSEIGISNSSKTWLNFNTKPVISLDKNIFASLVLAVVAIASTVLFFTQLKETRTIPKELKVEVLKSGVRGDQFSISLRMTDDKSLFRWLEPNSFRLKTGPKDEDLLLPSAVRVVDESTQTEQETRVYSAGPLLVNFEFEIKKADTKDFELIYSSLFTEPQKIHAGVIQ